jgi:hypothetical protein
MSSKALLVLSDGMVFEGRGFGYEGEALGEVIFNTSMTVISGDPYRPFIQGTDRYDDLSPDRQLWH